MKKVLLLGILVFSFIALLSNANAEIPKVLNYQASITLENGRPIEDGGHDMLFALYEQQFGGSPVWVESKQVVSYDGFINVYLGTESPLNLDWNKQYWIEIKVGNNDPFPRTRFVSVPYSLSTKVAELADSANFAWDIADTVHAMPEGPAGGDLEGEYPNPVLREGVVLENITRGSITQEMLAPNICTTPCGPASGDLTGTYPDPLIAPGAVKTDRIFNGAVTTEKIANWAVTNMKLAADAVTTDKIMNGTILWEDVDASEFEFWWNEMLRYTEAGGDLYGYYPDPLVGGLMGVPLSEMMPMDGDVYVYYEGEWMPMEAMGDVVGPYNELTVTGFDGWPLMGEAEVGDVYMFDGEYWMPMEADGVVYGPYNALEIVDAQGVVYGPYEDLQIVDAQGIVYGPYDNLDIVDADGEVYGDYLDLMLDDDVVSVEEIYAYTRDGEKPMDIDDDGRFVYYKWNERMDGNQLMWSPAPEEGETMIWHQGNWITGSTAAKTEYPIIGDGVNDPITVTPGENFNEILYWGMEDEGWNTGKIYTELMVQNGIDLRYITDIDGGDAYQVLRVDADAEELIWDDISVYSDDATILGDGTMDDPLMVGEIDGTYIIDGTIYTEDLAAGQIGLEVIADPYEGLPGDVLRINYEGDAAVWSQITVFTDEMSIEGDGTLFDPIRVAMDGIETFHIMDQTIMPEDIMPGIPGAALITDDDGTEVLWGTPMTYVADPLNGTGTEADPIRFPEDADNDNIFFKQDDAWTTGKIYTDLMRAGEIDLAEIGNPYEGLPNQVLRINEANNQVIWDDITVVTGFSLTGDGTLDDPLEIAEEGVENAHISQWAVDTYNIFPGGMEGQALVINGDYNVDWGYPDVTLTSFEDGTELGQVMYWNGAAWTFSRGEAPMTQQVLKWVDNGSSQAVEWADDGLTIPFEYVGPSDDATMFSLTKTDVNGGNGIDVMMPNDGENTGSAIYAYGGGIDMPTVDIYRESEGHLDGGALRVVADIATLEGEATGVMVDVDTDSDDGYASAGITVINTVEGSTPSAEHAGIIATVEASNADAAGVLGQAVAVNESANVGVLGEADNSTQVNFGVFGVTGYDGYDFVEFISESDFEGASAGVGAFNEGGEENDYALFANSAHDATSILTRAEQGTALLAINNTDNVYEGEDVIEWGDPTGSFVNYGTGIALYVSGYSEFEGDVNVEGDLKLEDGYVLIENDLTVEGYSIFNSSVTVNADMDVNGLGEFDEILVNTNGTFGDNVWVGGNLGVDGTTWLNGDLDVDGDAEFDANVTILGLLTAEELLVNTTGTFGEDVWMRDLYARDIYAEDGEFTGDLDVDGLGTINELYVNTNGTFVGDVWMTDLYATDIYAEDGTFTGLGTFNELSVATTGTFGEDVWMRDLYARDIYAEDGEFTGDLDVDGLGEFNELWVHTTSTFDGNMYASDIWGGTAVFTGNVTGADFTGEDAEFESLTVDVPSPMPGANAYNATLGLNDAAVMGGIENGSLLSDPDMWGALGYYDGTQMYAGFFNGLVNIDGTFTVNGMPVSSTLQDAYDKGNTIVTADDVSGDPIPVEIYSDDATADKAGGAKAELEVVANNQWVDVNQAGAAIFAENTNGPAIYAYGHGDAATAKGQAITAFVDGNAAVAEFENFGTGPGISVTLSGLTNDESAIKAEHAGNGYALDITGGGTKLSYNPYSFDANDTDPELGIGHSVANVTANTTDGSFDIELPTPPFDPSDWDKAYGTVLYVYLNASGGNDVTFTFDGTDIVTFGDGVAKLTFIFMDDTWVQF